MAKSKKNSWLKPYLSSYKGLLLLSIVLSSLVLIFAVGLMFTSGFLISSAATVPGAIMLLQFPLIFVRVFGVGKPPLKHVERIVSHDWVFRMTSGLRRDLWLALEKGMDSLGQKYSTGKILGLLNADIAHLQNLYLRSIFPMVSSYLVLLIALLCLGFLPLASIILIAVPLLLVCIAIPALSLKSSKNTLIQLNMLNHQMYAKYSDTVLGLMDWRASGRQEDCLEELKALQMKQNTLEAQAHRRSTLRSVLSQLLLVLSLFLLAYSSAAYFSAPGTELLMSDNPDLRLSYSANWIAAYILAFFPLMEAFLQLAPAAEQAQAHMHSLKSLSQLEPPSADERKGFEDARATAPAASQKTAGSKAADVETQESLGFVSASKEQQAPGLLLQDLSFSYLDVEKQGGEKEQGDNKEQGGKKEQSNKEEQGGSRWQSNASTWALQDINFELQPQDKLLILGKSGSGKSSLLKLISAELKPSKGKVLIKQEGASIEPKRSLCSIMRQDSYIFRQSVLENLKLAKENLSEEEAWQALKAVQLDRLVTSLPKALHSSLSEAASEMSGGERQRFALARLLLQNKGLVLLDEPTAGLDLDTEQAVLANIFELLSDKTVIVVSHNLEVLKHVNKLALIKQGSLAAFGDKDELIQSSAYLQALVDFDKKN